MESTLGGGRRLLSVNEEDPLTQSQLSTQKLIQEFNEAAERIHIIVLHFIHLSASEVNLDFLLCSQRQHTKQIFTALPLQRGFVL